MCVIYFIVYYLPVVVKKFLIAIDVVDDDAVACAKFQSSFLCCCSVITEYVASATGKHADGASRKIRLRRLSLHITRSSISSLSGFQQCMRLNGFFYLVHKSRGVHVESGEADRQIRCCRADVPFLTLLNINYT